MGYRTVVILNNDLANEWAADPLLGQKIAVEMTKVASGGNIGYGNVVQCVHADTQTLAVIDSFEFKTLSSKNWSLGEPDNAIVLKLLKDAADKMGYRLVKKA